MVPKMTRQMTPLLAKEIEHVRRQQQPIFSSQPLNGLAWLRLLSSRAYGKKAGTAGSKVMHPGARKADASSMASPQSRKRGADAIDPHATSGQPGATSATSATNSANPPSSISSKETTSSNRPRINPTALNAYAVNQLSARKGRAQPHAGASAGSTVFAEKYNAVARKVTMTIVALPIAIVTSYFLYQRLVLGEERKRLVPAEVKNEKNGS